MKKENGERGGKEEEEDWGKREMGRGRKKGKGYGERRRRLKTVEKGNGTVKKK